MTKSFSLSVLVAVLPVVAACAPLAVWLAFDTPGRQGVSALPALVPTLLLGWPLARAVRLHLPVVSVIWAMLGLLWQGVLWVVAVTPSPAQTFAEAFARALSEWLYAASPVLLIGVAGSLATLGLMMSNSPVRGSQD
ncbi:hypothetical protein [Thalassovita sp.]|uniref:hypothetical protein n=1 Tax=Thalassovita sp. TaxID=1979401 RepID=UPI003B592774